MIKGMAEKILADLDAYADRHYFVLEDPDILAVIEKSIKDYTEEQHRIAQEPRKGLDESGEDLSR
jgi:hypothetical protein